MRVICYMTLRRAVCCLYFSVFGLRFLTIHCIQYVKKAIDDFLLQIDFNKMYEQAKMIFYVYFYNNRFNNNIEY